MVDIICAICGKKQRIETLYPATFKEDYISKSIFSARRLPDKVHYKINKCLNCSLVFSSPVFPAKKLSNFYRKSLCNYKDQVPYLIETYFNVVKKFKDKLPKNPKVLEVGCGNGFFLKALNDLKFTKNIFGVEPSSKMISEADTSLQGKIKNNIFKQNLFPKNSFDLVLCFHTLDHMIDPDKFIKESYSLLKKNGYVVVIVHDMEGLSVKLFGERSPIFDIEHIYLFNRKTLNEIFQKNEFEVVKVFNLINNYPLYYWIKMSGFPVFIKRYASFVANIVRVNKISLSIPAGNIALIAKKSV